MTTATNCLKCSGKSKGRTKEEILATMTANQVNRAIVFAVRACMTPRDCQYTRDLYAALRVARVAT